MSINRIDPTPVQISNTVSIARQGAKKDFGDRLGSGADKGVVTNGGAISGSMLSGGAIVSAAVSQAGHGSHGSAPGAGGGAVGASYGATGVVTLGGGGGGVNTTVGGTTSGGVTMGTTVGAGGTATSGTNYIPSTGDSTIGDMNQQLIQSQSENAEMMDLQTQMQRENIVFTSVSNVLKTRQDTAKNSISNVR